ncbi:hypothetical protein [Paraburkholderia sp. PGU19]|uniref:hypothetical protein n=1 Tax=Paraburkholderia sp. PGU19 TaxID=2735434 RepID=UPI0015D9BB5B|nr:hypothetical protein [Paraburkholderia sp. PGU19]
MRQVALPAIMNGVGELAVIVVLAGLAQLHREGERFQEHVGLISGIPQNLTFDQRMLDARPSV